MVKARSSHRWCSMKKAFLKNFAIFVGKHPCLNLFLIKFIKKRLQHRCLEVYNRYFWHILFICSFQINKKAYLQTLKFLPIPQTFPMTPFILKIIMLKKDTYKPQTSLWLLLYQKLKRILTNTKYLYNPHSH